MLGLPWYCTHRTPTLLGKQGLHQGNKEGQDQYTTEIKGREMQMLDSRGGQDGGQGGGYQPPQQQQGGYQQPAAQNKPQGGQQQAPQQQAPQGMDSFDDDIPF